MWLFNKVPEIKLCDMPKNGLLIDVREPQEYKQKKIGKSKNIPLSKIDSFTTNKDVYVICASGSRSKRAVKSLRKRGINAINIKGGMFRNG